MLKQRTLVVMVILSGLIFVVAFSILIFNFGQSKPRDQNNHKTINFTLTYSERSSDGVTKEQYVVQQSNLRYSDTQQTDTKTINLTDASLQKLDEMLRKLNPNEPNLPASDINSRATSILSGEISIKSPITYNLSFNGEASQLALSNNGQIIKQLRDYLHTLRP